MPEKVEPGHSRESAVVSFSPGVKKSQMTRRSWGRKLEDTPSRRQWILDALTLSSIRASSLTNVSSNREGIGSYSELSKMAVWPDFRRKSVAS